MEKRNRGKTFLLLLFLVFASCSGAIQNGAGPAKIGLTIEEYVQSFPEDGSLADFCRDLPELPTMFGHVSLGGLGNHEVCFEFRSGDVYRFMTNRDGNFGDYANPAIVWPGYFVIGALPSGIELVGNKKLKKLHFRNKDQRLVGRLPSEQKAFAKRMSSGRFIEFATASNESDAELVEFGEMIWFDRKIRGWVWSKGTGWVLMLHTTDVERANSLLEQSKTAGEYQNVFLATHRISSNRACTPWIPFWVPL